MSEDMVNDGYEDIMNIDISSVAIEMMRRKYEYIPQLKCIFWKINFFNFYEKSYITCSEVSTKVFGQVSFMNLNRYANGC